MLKLNRINWDRMTCCNLVERKNIFQIKLEIENENDKESRETLAIKMQFLFAFNNKYDCSDVFEDE